MERPQQPSSAGLLSARQAAAYLNVSASHFRRQLAHLLPRVWLGGHSYRWKPEDLERWIEEHTIQPADEQPRRRRASVERVELSDPRAREIYEELAEYKRVSEARQKIVREFLSERCTVRQGLTVPSRELYLAFREWSAERRGGGLTLIQFSGTLELLGVGGTGSRQSYARTWSGIALRR